MKTKKRISARTKYLHTIAKYELEKKQLIQALQEANKCIDFLTRKQDLLKECAERLERNVRLSDSVLSTFERSVESYDEWSSSMTDQISQNIEMIHQYSTKCTKLSVELIEVRHELEMNRTHSIEALRNAERETYQLTLQLERIRNKSVISRIKKFFNSLFSWMR
jgi:hypothetical protein